MTSDKKFAIVLACYNKIDDLLAHIDIIKCYPFDVDIIVVYMGENDKNLNKIQDCHLVSKPSPGFYLGSLMSLVHGIREANALGYDYICFRNCDDWLFNYNFVQDNLTKMSQEGVRCAAYNWLTVQTLQEFALNELYCNVKSFMEHIEEMEDSFLHSNKKWLCEYKVSKWIRRVIKDNPSIWFYRLPDREREPGIGYIDNISTVFDHKGIPMPANFWELHQLNNRFFNFNWQLIGSHDNKSRFYYWNKIKNHVSYREQLETKQQFSNWLNCCLNNGNWNELPLEELENPALTTINQKKKIRNKLKILFRK